jgi:hypothetical protein
MKIALLLSGQYRHGKHCFNSIYENLLKHYDIDVFIGYIYEEPDTTIEELIETYNPKDIVYEKYDEGLIEKFKEMYKYPRILETNPFTLCQMWYGIIRTNMLKQKYESDNNMKYDVVIRARFDTEILHKVELNLPNNELYIPRGWNHRGGINDLFAYGDSESMDYYASTYNSIDEYVSEGRVLHPENVLRVHLEKGNVKIIRQPIELSLRGQIISRVP